MENTTTSHLEKDQEHKALLEKHLWSVAKELRGQMDAAEYQKYILGVIFYKYLSEKTEAITAGLLENDNTTYQEAWKNEEFQKALANNLRDILGYVVEPQYLYSHLLEEIQKGQNGKWSTDVLQSAFNNLIASTIGTNSQSDFEGLFDDISLTSPNLGITPDVRNQKMGSILKAIGLIDFHLEDAEIDVLGDAYEYLISQFAGDSGKKGGEFYTPQPVSKIIAKIISHEIPEITSVYDPTCGSGSLLLRMVRETPVEKKDTVMIYGQEKNTTTYNLARMNMILHGVRFSNFSIKNGDTLTHDMNKGVLVDACGANPPYSIKWKHSTVLEQDARYAPFSRLAPEDKADYAFIADILAHLKPNGVAGVVLPHGVLFRGGAEGVIRKNIVDKNYVHAIISLPANMFYGTGIPTVIVVFKKDRKEKEKILFIDAALHFVKNGNKNAMTEDQAQAIINTYKSKEELDKYSRLVELEEIKKNDYNLNVSRYLDTSEPEELIDLSVVKSTLSNLNKKLEEYELEIEEMVAQLEPVDEQ
jgi:type I restriction enzyme M protein